MEHYTRVQSAILYIEEHLQEQLNFVDIARAAGFSLYHFQRLFHAVSGFTVQEYIRKRRLAEAAAMLRETNSTVLQIAVSYQYGSQEAFTRAFTSCFEITPAKYRNSQTSLTVQPQIDFIAYGTNIRGGLNMYKPEIVDLATLKIIGFNYQTQLNNEKYFEEIPGFYDHFGRNEYYLRIPNKARPAFAYGISHSYEDNGEFSYLIGEEVASFAEMEPGFGCFEIPAGKYAAFKVNSAPELGQNTWKYIYGTWLPNSNYERREGPDFEVTDVLNSLPGKINMTVYIPIKS
ncbi:effector binding domain-containing protein [Paenibacillus sp. GCM10027627]|uniref:effector binding domain-containing protein n=1 Tax=unclassified Paenibacillus TaxID=185978 RepID=UPI003637AFFC